MNTNEMKSIIDQMIEDLIEEIAETERMIERNRRCLRSHNHVIRLTTEAGCKMFINIIRHTEEGTEYNWAARACDTPRYEKKQAIKAAATLQVPPVGGKIEAVSDTQALIESLESLKGQLEFVTQRKAS